MRNGLKSPYPSGVWAKVLKGRSWPPLRMLFLISATSGEQLSLNVADDSAKTLSVLGNMGDFLDDCRLRFLQMCRRPPQK